MLLPHTNLEGSIKVAERLRIEISNGKIILEKEVLENFTASFGVVAAHKNSTIDELLIKADKALYEAKESGRNRVCSFKE